MGSEQVPTDLSLVKEGAPEPVPSPSIPITSQQRQPEVGAPGVGRVGYYLV